MFVGFSFRILLKEKSVRKSLEVPVGPPYGSVVLECTKAEMQSWRLARSLYFEFNFEINNEERKNRSVREMDRLV